VEDFFYWKANSDGHVFNFRLLLFSASLHYDDFTFYPALKKQTKPHPHTSPHKKNKTKIITKQKNQNKQLGPKEKAIHRNFCVLFEKNSKCFLRYEIYTVIMWKIIKSACVERSLVPLNFLAILK